MIHIGCAGWALAKPHVAEFPPDGTHLARYAQRFSAVEINSSFYRPHQRKTYLRWAESVPSGFRFAVKIPKEITHARRLIGCEPLLDVFFEQVSGLGEKLGVFLVQLPPSLSLDATLARGFFRALRDSFRGPIVCEPRHPSWFSAAGEGLLEEWRIGRVAADPPPAPTAFIPGGDRQVTYFRLHGSPQVYYSAYPHEFLAQVARELERAERSGAEAWCIFDNTALGHAIPNALSLQARLRGTQRRSA